MATSGESTTSSEAEALKNSFDYLVKSIDTDSLLPAALSRKLITEYQREECSCESDRYKKAEKFIGHVLRAVNGDSHNFYVFIKVLKGHQPSIAGRIHGQFILISGRHHIHDVSMSPPCSFCSMYSIMLPPVLLRVRCLPCF